MPSKPRKAPTAKDVGETDIPTCNVPTCQRRPTTRGLCGGHWATHRGLATKE